MVSHQKHHYVPRFYLDRWTSPLDKRLGYFQWINGALRYTRIGAKSAGVQTELYSLDKAFGRQRQQLETRFFTPDIDDPGARVIGKLVNDRADKLTPVEKAVFSKYLVAQRYRSPDFVAHIRAEGKLFMESMLERNEEIYQAAKQVEHPPSLREWIQSNMVGLEDSLGVGMLPNLVSQPDVINRICAMTWVVIDFSAAKHALMTSDMPVVFTCGIAERSCIVALPLSPTLAFMAGGDLGHLNRLRKYPTGAASLLTQGLVFR
jgi:hypothetical protein